MIVYRELSSLEKDLGFHAKTLYAVSNNLGKHYHNVQLPKKSGGIRASRSRTTPAIQTTTASTK